MCNVVILHCVLPSCYPVFIVVWHLAVVTTVILACAGSGASKDLSQFYQLLWENERDHYQLWPNKAALPCFFAGESSHVDAVCNVCTSICLLLNFFLPFHDLCVLAGTFRHPLLSSLSVLLPVYLSLRFCMQFSAAICPRPVRFLAMVINL